MLRGGRNKEIQLRADWLLSSSSSIPLFSDDGGEYCHNSHSLLCWGGRGDDDESFGKLRLVHILH